MLLYCSKVKISLSFINSFILLLSIPSIIFSQDLTVASGGYITIAKEQYVYVGSNFTNLDGTVTLNSSSDQFSSLLVSGTTSGNISYNRYVNTAGVGEWDLIGPPVSGLSFATFIQDPNIATNGSFYAVGSYSNASNTWTNVTNATQGNLVLSQGYQMATTNGGTLFFTGAMANGNQSIMIQNNHAANSGIGTRWNLVANPFASYLYANTNANPTNNFLTVNTAAIDDAFKAIYGWNANGTGYTIYNNTSPPTYIAPGQGFFIAAAGNGEDQTINFTKAMQTVIGADDFILGRTSATYQLVLDMYHNTQKIGDTKFYFKDGLTLGLDPGYDAGTFNQSTVIGSRLLQQDNGIAMGINAMSIDDMSNIIIPLVINQDAGIPFTIQMANNTMPQDIKVYVEDTQHNDFTLLNTHSFQLLPQTNLRGDGRFFLHLTRNTLSTDKINRAHSLNVYKVIGTKQVTIEGLPQFSQSVQLALYNLLGMKIISKNIQSPARKETLSTAGIKAGIYILQVNSANSVFTKKVLID
jgi:hypothetical protein